MDAQGYLIVFGGIAAFLALSYYVAGHQVRQESRRSEALAETAVELGLDFEQKPLIVLGANPMKLVLFERKDEIRDVLQGSVPGVNASLFQYRYLWSRAESSVYHTESVGLFQSQALDLPHFTARPNDIRKKIGIKLWFEGNRVDIAPGSKFADHYGVNGDDTRLIRMLFGPQVRAFFEQNPGLYVEGNSDHIVFFVWTKRFTLTQRGQMMGTSPQDVRTFMELGHSILTALSAR